MELLDQNLTDEELLKLLRRLLSMFQKTAEDVERYDQFLISWVQEVTSSPGFPPDRVKEIQEDMFKPHDEGGPTLAVCAATLRENTTAGIMILSAAIERLEDSNGE